MKRILSIDIFRGMTLFFMILVNTQSGGGFSFLIHKSGTGWTLADLVYPFFIFIVGASTYLAMRKYDGKSDKLVIFRILRRTLYIFLFGILFNWVPFTESLLDVRIMGVLQRIALVYLACSLITLRVKGVTTLLSISGLLLGGYWLLTAFCGYACVDQVDLAIIGTKHLYTPTHDPEGLLSSIPAVANALAGYVAARMVMESESKTRLKKLFVLGLVLFVLSQLLHFTILPIYKTYWSASFGFLTIGLAAMTWSVIHLVVDVYEQKRWGFFFVVFGTNSIVCYLLSEFVAVFFREWGLAERIIGCYNAFMTPAFTSICWGLTVVVICYLVVLPLYRKKIFLRL